MVTGLSEQADMEHEHVKKNGVENTFGDSFDSVQENSGTFCWYLFEMPLGALHHRESSGVD